jgi:hypothetical protein
VLKNSVFSSRSRISKKLTFCNRLLATFSALVLRLDALKISHYIIREFFNTIGQNRSFVTPPISVLFGAANIPVKEGAKEKRLEQRRDTILEKRRKAVEQHKAQDPRDDATLEGE